VHKSTGCTPNSVVFGTELWEPADLIYGVERGNLDFPCRVTFIEHLKKMIRTGHRFVRENLGITAEHQKRDFDRRARPKRFEPGDIVYRYFPPKANRKIGPKWDGPYTVIRSIGGTTYELQTSHGKVRWHVDYLKPAFGRDGPIQAINLDRAPEFQELNRLGRDVVRFEQGKVVPGKEIPERLLVRKEKMGVKKRGRPKNPKAVSPAGGKPANRIPGPKKRRPKTKKKPIPAEDNCVIERQKGKQTIKAPDRLGY